MTIEELKEELKRQERIYSYMQDAEEWISNPKEVELYKEDLSHQVELIEAMKAQLTIEGHQTDF